MTFSFPQPSFYQYLQTILFITIIIFIIWFLAHLEEIYKFFMNLPRNLFKISLYVRPFYRSIKGIVGFYFKKRKENRTKIEQENKAFYDNVFQAYLLTREGNLEGWKEIDWLKHKYGKRRVNKLFQRMCQWPSYNSLFHQDSHGMERNFILLEITGEKVLIIEDRGKYAKLSSD